MQHKESTFHASDGVTLYAQSWWPDAAPRGYLALIHGLGEHSGCYHGWAECWTQQGIAVLAFDLRGHGKSPGKRGHVPSYERVLDDMQAFVTDIQQQYGAPFLYGHSLGGGLVINAGLRPLPVHGIIASGPALEAAPQPKPKLALGRAMMRIWPAFSMSNGLRNGDLVHDTVDPVKEGIPDPLLHSRISATLGIQMLDAGTGALAAAATYPTPLLIVHGQSDRITSPQASARFAETARSAGRDVTFIGYPEWYHEIHRERGRERLLADCLVWMAQHGL